VRHLHIGPELLPVVILAAATLAFLVAAPAVRRREVGVAGRRASRVLLVGTMLAVLVVTLPAGPIPGELATERSVNLAPGVEITRSLNLADRHIGLLNVIGNIAMFVPVGFLAVIALRTGVVAATAWGLVFSGGVEIVQYGLGRVADVDDILLNTTGAFVGAVIAASLRGVGRGLSRLRTASVRPMAPSGR
jgi:glycopeptide antibiotics resistance protein